MLKQVIVITFLLLITSKSPAAEDDWELITIVPKHEAASDSSLLSFLDSLESAVVEKDSLFIFEHLHENIKVSFGYPSTGMESFTEYWKPFDENSRLWPNMLRSIRSGGGWSKTGWGSLSFMMPYRIDPRDSLCSRTIPDGSEQSMQFHQEEGGAYVADTLRVLHVKDEKPVQFPEQPWQDKPSPEFLRKIGINDASILIRAYLPDQRRGYVPCDDILSPADGCQLYFIKAGSGWSIICCMGEYPDLASRR